MESLDIENAGRVATKKSGAFYRKGDQKAEGLMDGKAHYFLENWDNERLTFRSELFKLGYKTEWLKAPWNWKMHKRREDGSILTITYIEGDIYMEVIPSTK